MLEAGRPESWEANIDLILCFLVLRLPSSLPISITVSLHSSFLACRPPAPDGFGHLNFDPSDLFRISYFVLRIFNLSDAAELRTYDKAQKALLIITR